MADEVDFEPEYDEEQPIDEAEDEGQAEPHAPEEMRNGSAAAGPKSGKGRKGATKGRGHQNASMEVENRRVVSSGGRRRCETLKQAMLGRRLRAPLCPLRLKPCTSTIDAR